MLFGGQKGMQCYLLTGVTLSASRTSPKLHHDLCRTVFTIVVLMFWSLECSLMHNAHDCVGPPLEKNEVLGLEKDKFRIHYPTDQMKNMSRLVAE